MVTYGMGNKFQIIKIMTKKEGLKVHNRLIKIPHQSRRQLIRLVIFEKISVKSAHSLLGINYSTAKMIVRKYKHNGKITHFKSEREVKAEQNAPDQNILNQEPFRQISQTLKLQQNEGQHFGNSQFPTFFVPSQPFYSETTYPNSVLQFYQVQPMIWWDPVQKFY